MSQKKPAYHIYAFRTEIYRELPMAPDAPIYDAPEREIQVMEVATYGSVETRARRRLLNEIHKRGWFVRYAELVGSQPVYE